MSLELLGKRLGNYMLVSELGSGTYGSVYLGKHALLENRPLVAVKVLHASLRTETERERFLREARLLDALKHPNILPVYDAGEEEGTPFFVVAYAPGGSLRDLLLRQPGSPLSLKDAIRWLDQIGRALQFAHDHHIVHRDLKPENILFTAEDEALLSDFSIATKTLHTHISTHLGTPPYMAPEQFMGQVSKKSDQYALGCMAYEMLTGQRPFPGLDVYSAGYMHVHEQPLAPSQLNPAIPPMIERAILKTMAKDRHNRYETLDLFIHDLHHGLQRAGTRTLVTSKPVITQQNIQNVSLTWTASTEGDIRSSPAVSQGMIYVGSWDHHVYAFDAFDGGQYWKTPTRSFISSKPVVQQDLVYVGSADHNLYALHAATGEIRWSFLTRSFITSSPVVMNNTIYIGSWDYYLYAVDASSGSLRWSVITGDAIVASPVITNGMIYVGVRDGKLYAFEAATGRLRWVVSTEGNITATPAVTDGVVYVGSWDGKLYAFDALVGRKIWSITTKGSVGSSPVVVGGAVYIGSDDGRLYALEVTGGRLLWSVATKGPISAQPVVQSGMVYAGSGDGKVYAFDAVSGRQLWHAATGGAITDSPVVMEDVIYVGSEDGKLYAFRLMSAEEGTLTSEHVMSPCKMRPYRKHSLKHLPPDSRAMRRTE